MPSLPHLSSFHLLNLESETGSHTAGDGSKPSYIWLYTRRSVCSKATPTVLGQEPQLLSNQADTGADTAPNVKIITSWVQSVACCGQIWKVAWLRLKGRRQLEGEEVTLALNSDRCADAETERRCRNLSSLRNCLPQSLRQEVAGCVSRTARKIVWLEVRMGKGPKRKMGWGFYSECSRKLQKDYKQSRSNDHICIKHTIFMHLARHCAWCSGQSSEPRWIIISSRKGGGGGEERQAYRQEDMLMVQQLGWRKWMDSKYSLRWNWYNLMMDWEWRVRKGPSRMNSSFLLRLVRVSDLKIWVPHPFLLCPETSSSIGCILFKYFPQKSMMISYTLR